MAAALEHGAALRELRIQSANSANADVEMTMTNERGGRLASRVTHLAMDIRGKLRAPLR